VLAVVSRCEWCGQFVKRDASSHDICEPLAHWLRVSEVPRRLLPDIAEQVDVEHGEIAWTDIA
jgi:hypothetical protein